MKDDVDEHDETAIAASAQATLVELVDAADARRQQLEVPPVDIAGASDSDEGAMSAGPSTAPMPMPQTIRPNTVDGATVRPRTSRGPTVQREDTSWPPGVPRIILGQAVTFEAGRRSSCGLATAYEARLRVKCPNADHGQCNKSRSVRVDLKKYGPRAPEAFLGAWLELSFEVDRDEHRLPPSEECIRDYLARHPR